MYEVVPGILQTSSGRIGVSVAHERSNGAPSGAARVKLFRIADANPADFVRREGDTMNGRLRIIPQDTATLELRAGGLSSSQANVFWIEDAARNLIFNVGQRGNIDSKDGYIPSRDVHLTPKKYVDDNFVKKTGDTINGELTIESAEGVTAGSPLLVKGGPDLDLNQNILNVYNGAGKQMFWVDGKDIGTMYNYEPTDKNHVTNKKYVDTEVDRLYYPARYSWRVKPSSGDSPPEGWMHFNGSSMSNSTNVRINFKSDDSRLDLYDISDEKVIYSGPSNSAMMLTGWYRGSDTDYKWKWKGTANLTRIVSYFRNDRWYFLCNIGNYQTSNMSFADGATYYFTLSGLF